MSDIREELTSTGLKYGIIAGLGCILVTLILYIINLDLVLGFWIWSGYVVIVGVKIYVGYQLRKANQGFLDFKDGIKALFPISVVSLAIWIAFNGLLFTVIDPELIERSEEKAVERTLYVLELSGADENTIEETIEKVRGQDYSPSFRTSILNYATSCIVGFIYTLIIAAILFYSGKSEESQKATEAP